MANQVPESGPEGLGNHGFPTTHWSVIIEAGNLESEEASEALEHLCRVYWYPLYAYVRRRGYQQHQAEDLTQEFFANFVTKNYFARACPEKGRMRSYILGAINHFLSDARDRAGRLKRGGGYRFFSFDVEAGEERFVGEPRNQLSPDRLFERRWALTVLEQVLTAVEKEYREEGKGPLFEKISGFLIGQEDTASYGRIADELGMSQGALRVAIHRLRKRYRELFKVEIARTVATPQELDEEMRHLVAVLSE